MSLGCVTHNIRPSLSGNAFQKYDEGVSEVTEVHETIDFNATLDLLKQENSKHCVNEENYEKEGQHIHQMRQRVGDGLDQCL